MSDPLISVVTATIGRREAMLRKLDALRAQSLPPERFEWLVCENGGEGSLLEELERQPREFALRTAHLPTNLGPSVGRNAAARLASAGVLYLSDDDCLPEPATLERHLAVQGEPCLALGPIDFVDSGALLSSWRPRRPGYWNVNGANTSLPTEAFRKVGGFDETLAGYGGEDVLLGYRLRRLGLPVRTVEDALTVHLGPSPAAGFDLDKARSAGCNAALIATRFPELRFRLGVSPLLLRAKLVTLAPLAPLLGPKAKWELAYARGAVSFSSGSGHGSGAGRRPEDA